MAASKPKTFRATLELLRSNLGWVIVRIPFDVKKAWGKSGRLKVRGEVNGVSFRTSLFPERSGAHFLLVNNKTQKAANIRLGIAAEFHLEPDTAPRHVSIPPEFRKLLRQSRQMSHWFDDLSYSARNWISHWIAEPKGAATRQKRADQMAERILETIEAELELPPLIRHAFAENPKARRGWERMTDKQRRGELLAIFYYRTPDSRIRRLQKTMETASAVADRSRESEEESPA